MKLKDENGTEYIFKADSFECGLGRLSKVQPEPQVIDWSRVNPDMPVISAAGVTRFYGELLAPPKTLETGKWVPWFGGDAPLPDGVLVECFLRRGTGSPIKPAPCFEWASRMDGSDIIAFCVTGLVPGYCY